MQVLGSREGRDGWDTARARRYLHDTSGLNNILLTLLSKGDPRCAATRGGTVSLKLS
jgi:hypothetical protein